MKSMLVFAVVALIACLVSAGGKSKDKDRRGNSCLCNGQCFNNTGVKNSPCYKNRVQYIGCQDTTCSVQTCPINSLFNYTSKVCEACATGFHVDAKKQSCVCDQGTTFNRTAKACVACPINAVVTADYCGCQNSVLDRTTNTCKDCPAGSTRRENKCQCTDRKQFWNCEAFACQNCPGVWQNQTAGSVRKPKVVEVCTCTGANQFFNRFSVTCTTCPANSVVVFGKEGGYCKCTDLTQVYDIKTNACVAWSAMNSGLDSFGSSEDSSWEF